MGRVKTGTLISGTSVVIIALLTACAVPETPPPAVKAPAVVPAPAVQAPSPAPIPATTMPAPKPVIPGLRDYKPRSTEETYYYQTLAAMVEALNGRAVDKFMGRVSSGYYRGFSRLETTLKNFFQAVPSFAMEVTPVSFADDDQKVIMIVTWRRSAKKMGLDQSDVDSGRSVLIFMKGTGLKLIDYEGDNLLGFKEG